MTTPELDCWTVVPFGFVCVSVPDGVWVTVVPSLPFQVH